MKLLLIDDDENLAEARRARAFAAPQEDSSADGLEGWHSEV